MNIIQSIEYKDTILEEMIPREIAPTYPIAGYIIETDNYQIIVAMSAEEAKRGEFVITGRGVKAEGMLIIPKVMLIGVGDSIDSGRSVNFDDFVRRGGFMEPLVNELLFYTGAGLMRIEYNNHEGIQEPFVALIYVNPKEAK